MEKEREESFFFARLGELRRREEKVETRRRVSFSSFVVNYIRRSTLRPTK